MIEMRDIFKLLEPIKRRIFLLIGRAILTAVNADEKYQKIQVTGLKDETITDVERAQEYGFETYPKKDSEAFIVFLNGNRDHGIAFCVSDKNNRPPVTLEEGEVIVYDFNGSYVRLLKDGSIRIEDKEGNYMVSDSSKWDINGNLTVDK